MFVTEGPESPHIAGITLFVFAHRNQQWGQSAAAVQEGWHICVSDSVFLILVSLSGLQVSALQRSSGMQMQLLRREGCFHWISRL